MYISLLNILGAGDAAGMYCMLYVASDLVDFNRKKNIETFLHLIL